MPTYQYSCGDCGENLEIVQKFTDDSLTVCPSCEGSLRKVFSAVGVVFKGSGFYRNDSRDNGKSGASSSNGDQKSSSSENGSSGSGDSSSSSSESGSQSSGSSDSGSSSSGGSGSDSSSSSTSSGSSSKSATSAA